MSKSRMKPIIDQVIVLTEATSSIGRVVATTAAERGAKVVLASSQGDELKALTEDIRQKGGEAAVLFTDVTTIEGLERLRDEAMKTFGRIDTWINNAGANLSGYLLDTDIAEEKQLFEKNFWGTRLGCQVAALAMKESGGTIINIGSEVSASALPLLGVYTASKNAVKAITDALRSELRDRSIPIEVTLVHPTSLEGDGSCADAIIKACENPQRDVYVGGPAKLTEIIDTFFPQVKDMVSETRMKEMKNDTETDYSKQSFIKTITQSARKSLENFRRAG